MVYEDSVLWIDHGRNSVHADEQWDERLLDRKRNVGSRLRNIKRQEIHDPQRDTRREQWPKLHKIDSLHEAHSSLITIYVAYFPQDHAFPTFDIPLFFFALHITLQNVMRSLNQSRSSIRRENCARIVIDKKQWWERIMREITAVIASMYRSVLFVIHKYDTVIRELPKAVVMNKSWSMSLCYIFPKMLLPFSLVIFG